METRYCPSLQPSSSRASFFTPHGHMRSTRNRFPSRPAVHTRASIGLLLTSRATHHHPPGSPRRWWRWRAASTGRPPCWPLHPPSRTVAAARWDARCGRIPSRIRPAFVSPRRPACSRSRSLLRRPSGRGAPRSRSRPCAA